MIMAIMHPPCIHTASSPNQVFAFPNLAELFTNNFDHELLIYQAKRANAEKKTFAGSCF